MAGTFPKDFEDLEEFAGWAQPTELGRHTMCRESSMEDVRAFYDVMVVRASDALQYLNQRPLDDLRPNEKNLLDLCLALTEAAVAVEMFQRNDPPYVMSMSRLRPMHDAW